MKSYVVGIFGPCDRKQATEIVMRQLHDFDLHEKHPEGYIKALIELPEKYDHKHYERWVSNTRRHGGMLVVLKKESAFPVQDLCDVVYKLEVTSQGRFTRITIMKFHKLAI